MPSKARLSEVYPVSDIEIAWAAGFMSVHGSLTASGGPGVIYQVRTSQHREAAERFAQFAGVKPSVYVRAGKETTAFDVRGFRLTRLMALVWSDITEDRRKQFTHLASTEQQQAFKREQLIGHARTRARAATYNA